MIRTPLRAPALLIFALAATACSAAQLPYEEDGSRAGRDGGSTRTGNADGTGTGNGDGNGTGSGDGTGSQSRRDAGGTNDSDPAPTTTTDAGQSPAPTDAAAATDASATPADGGGADGGAKAFGAVCTTNAECQSNACFVGGQGNFCSLRCTIATQAADCPTPPTTGACNNQGYCRKP